MTTLNKDQEDSKIKKAQVYPHTPEQMSKDDIERGRQQLRATSDLHVGYQNDPGSMRNPYYDAQFEEMKNDQYSQRLRDQPSVTTYMEEDGVSIATNINDATLNVENFGRFGTNGGEPSVYGDIYGGKRQIAQRKNNGKQQNISPFRQNKIEDLDKNYRIKNFAKVQRQDVVILNENQVDIMNQDSMSQKYPNESQLGGSSLENSQSIVQKAQKRVQDQESWWPMGVGASYNKKAETVQDLVNNNEFDIYPMSMQYSSKTIQWILLYRFVTLLCCCYFLIPFDLYIHTDRRIGYFATSISTQTVQFKDVSQSQGYLFDLQNCRVNVKEHTIVTEMMIRYNTNYGTHSSINSTTFSVQSLPDETCVIEIYLPPKTPLPMISLRFAGTQDNIILDDSDMNGVALNFSQGLFITGAQAFVFLNNHYMDQLFINLTSSICRLNLLRTNYKQIFIQSGVLKDVLPSDFAKNRLDITQPAGNICVYTPIANYTNQSQCPLITDPNFDVSTFSSSANPCYLQTFVCNSQSVKCYNDGSAFDSVTVVALQDGPVQITQQGTSQTNQALFPLNQTSGISFSSATKSIMNSTLNEYLDSSGEDMISVFQTIGVEYERTWVFTNRGVYFQAQFWSLLWSSAGQLTPDIQYMKYIMIDNSCPARTVVDNVDVDVRDNYYYYFPSTKGYRLALVSDYCTFFELWRNQFGLPTLTQILITENGLLIASFVVAFVIAVIGSLLLINTVNIYYKKYQRAYTLWVVQQQTFAITKNKLLGLEDNRTVLFNLNNIFDCIGNQKIYEKRNLFSTEFKLINQKSPNLPKSFNFSLFQVPTLFIDSIFRRYCNSLDEFLLSIPESPDDFTDFKMKQYPVNETSVSMADFTLMYVNFCQKFGFKEKNMAIIEDSQFTDLKLKRTAGLMDNVKVYQYLRFKTRREKNDDKADVKFMESLEGLSPIQRFLNSQCAITVFDNDYITFRDMDRAYKAYCHENSIPETQRVQIIASKEVIDFGSKISEAAPHERIIGLKMIQKRNARGLTQTLVRIPSGKNSAFLAKLIRVEGVIPNILITIIHFTMIILLPLFIPIILYQAFAIMTWMQPDVYFKPMEISDFTSPNKIDPWWDNIPKTNIFKYLQLLAGVYFTLAFTELISFNLTGFNNNGRFPITYSLPKKILQTLLYFMIGIILTFYFGMISYIIVWMILGAILNPSKHLPYATATITLITVVTVKIVAYKLKYQGLFKSFESVINQKMAAAMDRLELKPTKESIEAANKQTHIQKQKVQSKEIANEVADSFGLQHNHQDIINFRDISQLAKFAQKGLGNLQIYIIEICVSALVQDKHKLQESVMNLATELGVDSELLNQLSLLATNIADTKQQSGNDVSDIHIKKIFRMLENNLDQHLLTDLVEISLKQDPRCILKYLEQKTLPYDEILKILVYFLKGNKHDVRKELLNLITKVSEGHKSELALFKTFQDISQGNLDELYEQICGNGDDSKNKLMFKNIFPVLTMCAYQRKSPKMIIDTFQYSLLELQRQIGILSQEDCEKFVTSSMTQSEDLNPVARQLASLYTLCKGSIIDIRSICSQVEAQGPFDSDVLYQIYQASNGSTKAFEQAVYKLGFLSDRDLLLEFYNVLFMRIVDVPIICEKIQIDPNRCEALLCLTYLLSAIMEYEIMQDHSQDSYSAVLTSERSREVKIKIIRKRVKKCLGALQTELGILVMSNQRLKDLYKELERQSPRQVYELHTQVSHSRMHSAMDDLDISRDGERQLLDVTIEDSQSPKLKSPRKAKGLSDKDKLGKLLKLIFSSQRQDLTQELWLVIQNLDEVQEALGLLGLQMARCLAYAILEKKEIISPSNIHLGNSIEELGKIFKIRKETLEFVIDVSSGRPKDIFRIQSSNPQYNLKTNKFHYKFHHSRQKMLVKVLHCDPHLVQYAFSLWYHEHKKQQRYNEEVFILAENLDLDQEFLDIVKFYQGLNKEDSQCGKRSYEKSIMQYVEKGLNSNTLSQRRYRFGLRPISDKKLITGEFFTKQDGGSRNQVSYLDTPVLKVQTFRQVLTTFEQFINIYKGEKETLGMIFGLNPQQHVGGLGILKTMIRGTNSDLTISSLIKMLKKLGKHISISGKEQFSLFGKDSLSIHQSKTQQNLFIQLGIALNFRQFHNIQEQQSSEHQVTLDKYLKHIIRIANQARKDRILTKENEMRYVEDNEYSHILKALYERGYFKDIAVKLFSFIDSSSHFGTDLSPEECNLIIGLLLGASIKDQRLMRYCLISMLKDHNLNLELLDGIGATLTHDLQSIQSIKHFARQVELDGNFLVSLIDLVDHKSKYLPQTVAQLLQHLSEENQRICGSLVHLAKRDIPMVKYITQKLNMETDSLIPIIAAAQGNLSIMSEYYDEIGDKLQLSSVNSMRYLTELAHGRAECLHHLSQKRTKRFNISDHKLVDALFKLNTIGKRIVEKYLVIDDAEEYGSIDDSIKIVWRKLNSVFNLNQEQGVNLKNFMNVIIKACWRDDQAINTLRKKLQRVKNPRSIWYSEKKDLSAKPQKLKHLSEHGIYKFIRRSIKQVGQEAHKIQDYVEKEKKRLVKSLRTVIIPGIQSELEGKNRNTKQLENDVDNYYQYIQTPESNKVQQAIKDLTIQKAYKVGCTYGISLQKAFEQPFFYCQDCNNEEDDDSLVVCLMCALICHAGHKLVPGNYGKTSKIICDCGQDKYSKCSKLNNQCPVEGIRGKKSCQIVRKNYGALQEQAIIQVFGSRANADKFDDPTDLIFVTEEDDNYSTNHFLMDLTDAFELPTYFTDEGLINDLKVRNELNIDVLRGGTQYLMDSRLSLKLCLAQNILLLAQGSMTQSFTTLFSCKNRYTFEDYQNQSLYDRSATTIKSLRSYRTLSCLISLAERDLKKFQEYGDTICEVLGEIGNSEYSGLQKLSNVIMLGLGGKLPSLKSDKEGAKQSTSYLKLFQKLFGIDATKALLLHKFYLLSSKDLLQVLNLKNVSRKEMSDDLKNTSHWIERELFNNLLQIDEKSKRTLKNLLGLCIGHQDSLEYLALDHKISPTKVIIYKAFLSQDKKELANIFGGLNNLLPQELSSFLVKVWQGDVGALVTLIIEWLKRRKDGNWKDFKVKPKTNSLLEQNQHKYLSNLIYLMNGEQVDEEASLKIVIQRLTQENLFEDKEQGLQKDQFRILKCVQSVKGIMFNQSQDVSEIVYTIGKEDKKELLKSIINIMSKAWSNNDLKVLLAAFSLRQDGKIDPNDLQVIDYCKSLLLALEGDLVHLARIADEVLNPTLSEGEEMSQLRSLLASMITGSTKFDQLEDNAKKLEQVRSSGGFTQTPTASKFKNLLLREMYRLYERIAKSQLIAQGTPETKIDDLIRLSFREKLPLHVMMLISEDRSYIEKMFDPCQELSTNLVNQDHKSRKYIKKFIEFLDPYTDNSNIRTLLRHVTGAKTLTIKFPKVSRSPDMIKIKDLQLPDLQKEKSKDHKASTYNLFQEIQLSVKKDSIEVDLFCFSKLISNCYLQDKTAILQLSKVFKQIFESEPVYWSIIQVVELLIEKKDSQVFDHIPSVVALLLTHHRGEEEKTFTKQDGIIVKLIASWLKVFSIVSNETAAEINLEELHSSIKKCVTITLEYYQDQPKDLNFFTQHRDNMPLITDVLVGIISMCKLNFSGMRPLALKIGGFPDTTKLQDFFEIIRKNQSLIGNDYHPKENNDLARREEPRSLIIQTNAIGTDARSLYISLLNKSNSGKIGLEEFRELCKYMVIQLSPSQQIHIFASVDKNQSGNLQMNEFINAMTQLKQVITLEGMRRMGLSLSDLVLEFILSITILLLTFAFIFIGIAAFSPTSSFSSVTNSILPLCAGGAVNRSKSTEKSDEDLKQVTEAPN